VPIRRNLGTIPRPPARKTRARDSDEAKARGIALAKARCTEIAMLAASKGWGKQRSDS